MNLAKASPPNKFEGLAMRLIFCNVHVLLIACMAFSGCRQLPSRPAYVSAPDHDKGYLPFAVGDEWSYRKADAKDGWAGTADRMFLDGERQEGQGEIFSDWDKDVYRVSPEGIVSLHTSWGFGEMLGYGKRVEEGAMILAFPLSKGKVWTYKSYRTTDFGKTLGEADDRFEVKSIGEPCHTSLANYSDCLVIEDVQTSPITGHTIGLDGIHAVGGDSSVTISTYAYGVGRVKTENYDVKKGWFLRWRNLVSSSELVSFKVDVDQARQDVIYREEHCKPDVQCVRLPPPPPRPATCAGKIKCDPPRG